MSVERINSLVGLRGLAAMIVVLNHVLIRRPELAAAVEDGTAVPPSDTLDWVLVHTPAHLAWAGGEAVFVFFVLSGLVLTLPLLKAREFDWLAYYPSRFVRLYLPVWGSILLALVLFLVLRTADPIAASSWTAERGFTLDPQRILLQALILHDARIWNGPLWSIVWEVVFSVLLPVFFIALVRLRIPLWSRTLLVLAATILGSLLREQAPAIGNFVLYMSMFAIGVLIAASLDELKLLAARIDAGRRPGAVWGLLLIGALAALWCPWPVAAFGPPALLKDVLVAPQLVGAGVLVVLAVFAPRVRAVLEKQLVLWLGVISFSLYLVHDPLIVLIDLMSGSAVAVVLLGVPGSLLVAWGFYFVVERPSHRLARAMNQLVAARWSWHRRLAQGTAPHRIATGRRSHPSSAQAERPAR